MRKDLLSLWKVGERIPDNGCRRYSGNDNINAADGGGRLQPSWYYWIFAASGFAGLIYESLWARYLKLFLGHAAYAQILVLAVFLLAWPPARLWRLECPCVCKIPCASMWWLKFCWRWRPFTFMIFLLSPRNGRSALFCRA